MKEGWEIIRLGEVCTLDRIQNRGSALPYVGLEDIVSGAGEFTGSTEPKKVQSSTFKFTSDHILYGRLRPYLNKVFLPDFDGHCSTEIFPIRPAPNTDRRYLYYWLSMDSTVREIDLTSTGARMPRANMDAILEFPLPRPPLPEQERIVAILDEAFAGLATATANAEKNLKNARELFDGYLQAALIQESAGLSRRRLEDVVDQRCSLSYGIVQPGNEKADGLPIVRPVDLTKKVIQIDGLKRIDASLAKGYSRTSLRGGELLLCVRGTTGTVSIASEALSGANVTRGIVPIAFELSQVSQRFGYYALRSEPVQSQIREKTYGAALMQINIRDVRNLVIPVPSQAEQERIAANLDRLSDETSRLQEIYQSKLVELRTLKEALLEKAFSGALTSPPTSAIKEAAE